MATWVEDIVQALKNLGGEASLAEIYKEVKRIRQDPLPISFEASIRERIEAHSSDSANFKGKNFFRKVGKGVWALRDHYPESRQTPQIVKGKTAPLLYGVANIEFEDSANILRTIKQYREYKEHNTNEWEIYIEEIFQVLGFEMEEPIPGIKLLKKLGSEGGARIIAGIITKEKTFDEYSPKIRWEFLLSHFAQQFDIPWGILTNGLELRIIRFTKRGYSLEYSWSNFDEIIRNEALMPFYKIYSLILSIYEFPKTIPGIEKRNYQRQNRASKHAGNFTVNDHLYNKPGITVDLFYALRNRILSLSDSIVEIPAKMYISYELGRKFCEIHIQCNQLKVWIPLNVEEIIDPHSLGRDVRNIGHYGTGATEIILSEPERVDWVFDLIEQSYMVRKRN